MPRHDADPWFHSLPPDPFQAFSQWFEEANAALGTDPASHPMALATATPDGRPSVRMVLLKGFDGEGFVFYSNYASRKGRELEENPHAALLFWWQALRRQVRVEGTVVKLPPEVSDAYFRSRPRESQLSTWSVAQSEPVASRQVLDRAIEAARTAYEGKEVPRPPYWGGYKLSPTAFEFWESREARRHDRARYERQGAGGWKRQRLAP